MYDESGGTGKNNNREDTHLVLEAIDSATRILPDDWKMAIVMIDGVSDVVFDVEV